MPSVSNKSFIHATEIWNFAPDSVVSTFLYVLIGPNIPSWTMIWSTFVGVVVHTYFIWMHRSMHFNENFTHSRPLCYSHNWRDVINERSINYKLLSIHSLILSYKWEWVIPLCRSHEWVMMLTTPLSTLTCFMDGPKIDFIGLLERIF